MSVLDDLSTLLGPKGCLMGAEVPDGTERDNSGAVGEQPLALIRPDSVQVLSQALKICDAARQSVVPQGGLTGLAGGACTSIGQVALNLSRFSGVEEIDAQAGTLTVRAGTVLEVAQNAAAEAGWQFPIDLGARGSAQIGGLLATHAGGLGVLKYGTTRANVLGLEVVLADGTVLSHMNQAIKDNTGYDLAGLFIGSEGTLGVITRAVIRLHPQTGPVETALCAVPDCDAALALLARCRKGVDLHAFEAMWPDFFELNCSLDGVQFFPDNPPLAVLISAVGDIEATLADAFEAGEVADALLAKSQAEAASFWSVREGHKMGAACPGLLNLDISLRQRDMRSFVDAQLYALRQQYPNAMIGVFGHLGDGNLHVAGYDPDATPGFKAVVAASFYDGIRDLGGSVSAEHGIGTLKRPWLSHSRSEAEIETMRRIRKALDPIGILNPGKLF